MHQDDILYILICVGTVSIECDEKFRIFFVVQKNNCVRLRRSTQNTKFTKIKVPHIKTMCYYLIIFMENPRHIIIFDASIVI